jgi:RimJ/RimL family protein N-acetyltransferase
VSLRPLEAADLRGPYRHWLNDPETTRFLETGRVPTTAEALEKAFAHIMTDPHTAFFAIVDRTHHQHIGNIKLGPIHPIHRHASLGILIGDPRSRRRGCGLDAVELVVRYGFQQLNLHKITVGMYADHHASVRLFEKAGFTNEGRLRKHLFRDGTYYDKSLMGLLREVWLNRSQS